MCGICGCGTPDGASHETSRAVPAPHGHEAAQRRVRVEADLLAENARHAAANRARLDAAGVLAVDLVSGPGAGKTTLLERTVEALGSDLPIAAIEGDQAGERDAERLRALGIPVVQINTGRGCHLDAHQVGHALEALPLRPGTLLFLENVGNLVCPAAFPLGAHWRVALLSSPEGDDKPLKYPDLFAGADLLLLTKADLAPYVDFDAAAAIEHARRVRPGLPATVLSARSGAGLDGWLRWLRAARELHGLGR
ncbi:MAG: hydrogenase nickel incorporation protein HypB [Pseudomonadales bacterium]|jgi:hydrogenase nickel incorporation protein HypB|nr:hydrogenase nickel incorporation protein HypB [Pseudomonadales bacterium]